MMKAALIKRASTVFLQGVIVLIAIGTLAALLWEPQIEGVNAHATTLLEIYFDDPFLAYVYIGSIPFFVALYQAFTVLRYIGRNDVFSRHSVRAVRTIQYCAIMTAGAIVAADAFLMMMAARGEDDPAGTVMLGIVATFASLVIAAAAAVFESILQSAVDMKSEKE